MVGSRHPKGIEAFHPLIADQDVLKRIVQGMPHMQLSCNIRRGHNGRKRFFVPIHLCVKILVFTPLLIQFFLNLLWIIRLCQFLTHDSPPFSHGTSRIFHI